MHITDLPEEILDRAVTALDSPIDLKNLAAVCSRFHSLVEPYHTQFRIIRAPLISPLWQKFIGRQLLAQNVRILEIQPVEVDHYTEIYGLDAPVVPAIFSDLELPPVPELDSDEEDVGALRTYEAAKNDMDLKAERLLVSALKGMSGLTSFRWQCTPPLINPTQEDDIWITLAKYCPSLNSIDVFDREKPYEPILEERDDPAYQRPTRNPNFYSFQDLKLFSLKTVAFDVGDFAVPSLEQGGDLLVNNCPGLETLRLLYMISLNPHSKTVNATPLLSNAYWASLRELTLFGFHFISAELRAFLVSHPTITILSLMSIRIDEPLVLPAGVLPNLKRLSADLDSSVIDSVLNSPTSLPRPLESILGAVLNGVFLDKLNDSGSGATLKELRCECSDSDDLCHLITRLSGIAPNLECLHITNLDTKIPMDRSMYPVFGQFPNLRTLTGVRFIGTTCQSVLEATEIMRALVAICPNLRRINWFIGNHVAMSSIVAIDRNGSQVTWYILRAWAGNEGKIDTNWGEMGHGSFEL